MLVAQHQKRTAASGGRTGTLRGTLSYTPSLLGARKFVASPKAEQEACFYFPEGGGGILQGAQAERLPPPPAILVPPAIL